MAPFFIIYATTIMAVKSKKGMFIFMMSPILLMLGLRLQVVVERVKFVGRWDKEQVCFMKSPIIMLIESLGGLRQGNFEWMK